MSTSRLSEQRMPRKLVAATMIGNVVEWFDFAVYGSLAVVLGHVFFPTGSSAASLNSSLAVFGVAFLFRPIGGAVLGTIGDRYGRRAALTIAVAGISTATTLIAVLPSYSSAGAIAPILLILLRSLQGLSAGGEWASASAFLAEHSPVAQRGRNLSLISTSAAIAFALGSLSALALELNLSSAQMLSWGWRIPFLAAAPLGLIGVYLRVRLDETPVFREIRERGTTTRMPLVEAFSTSRKTLLAAFVCACATGVGFYYFSAYLVTAMVTDPRLGVKHGLLLSAASLLVYGVVFCPLAGALSDRIGRKPVYVGGAVGLVALAWPATTMVSSGHVGVAFLGLMLFGLPQSGLNAMVSSVLMELFPAHTRTSATALAYGLGVGPVAGAAPLIATSLHTSYGSVYAPTVFLMSFMALIAIALVTLLPETRGASLRRLEVSLSGSSELRV